MVQRTQMEPGSLEEIELGTEQLEFGVHSGESVPERELWIFRGWVERTQCALMRVCVGGRDTSQLTL